MIACNNCRAQNRDSARFCWQCGVRLPQGSGIGMVLGGEYRVVAVIKSGGMGMVYKAESGGKLYAVKEMRDAFTNPRRRAILNKLRSTSIVMAVIFLLATSAWTAGPTVKVTQVDPSHFPEVSIYVSVADTSGQPVTGLTKDDFQLFEDGNPVEIKGFAGLEEARSVDIVFVFDTTGSMRDEIEGVKNTSIAFANKLRDSNRDFRLGLVAFGDEVREVRNRDGNLTANAEEFKGWIGQLRADGGGDDPEISLDALKRATQMIYRDGTQKVLLLITDAPPHQKGDGTRFSEVVPAELVEQLRDEGYTIYAVAYDHPHFRRLVGETHGEFYDIQREPDFMGIIEKIGGLIADQYRLTYISARPFYDGTRRAVEVEVAGETAGGTYLEKHLIHIRSDGIVALALLLPLLLALALPTAMGKIRAYRPRRVSESEIPQVEALGVSGQPICPHCGHALRPGASFCGHCGQAVAIQTAEPRSTACPGCGHPLRPGARFCSGCGKRL